MRTAYADLLADQLPELNHPVANVEQIGLFTDPSEPLTRLTHWVMLGLFLGLLSAEWIVRKAGGLV